MWNICRLVLSVVFMIMLLTQVATAQDSIPGYCSELEATDCALLSASAEAMQDVRSATTATEIDFSVVNIPDASFSELALNYQTTSRYIVSDDLASFIEEIRNMSLLDRAAMMSEPAQLIGFLGEWLNGITTDTSFALTMSPELAEALSDEGDFPIPTDFALSFMLIDGVFYIDVTDLAAFVPELALFQGWIGFEIAPLLDLALAEAGMDEMNSEDSLIFAQAMTNLRAGSSGPFVTLLQEYGAPPSAEEFFQVFLSDDVSTDEDVVAFQTAIDYPAFFESPLFEVLAWQLLYQEDIFDLYLSETEVEEFIVGARLFGPSVMEHMNLDLVETVGTEDTYLYSSALTMDWDSADTIAFFGTIFGEEAISDVPEELPFISAAIAVDNADLNEPLEIVPPPGAFVIPLEMLMQFSEF